MNRHAAQVLGPGTVRGTIAPRWVESRIEPGRRSMRLLCCTLILTALLSACVVPSTDHDQPTAFREWRAFHAGVSAMDADARAQRYAQLGDAAGPDGTDMQRLQQAYLITYADALGPSSETTRSEARRLLQTIADAYELAPLRDMLLEILMFQQMIADSRIEVEEIGRECEVASERLLALRLKQAAMQGDIETCTEQLEALKQIENTMSDTDTTPQVPQ